MATRVEADLDDWEIPPLDEETRAELQAAGLQPATESFAGYEWRPVKKRPRWLAFLRRLILGPAME